MKRKNTKSRIKYNEIFLKAYETPMEAKKSIDKWINFYNQELPHQSLDRNTSDGLYFISG
jgi:putative transposase